MVSIPRLIIAVFFVLILPTSVSVGIGYTTEIALHSQLAGGLMFGWGLGLYAILVRHFRTQLLKIFLVRIWT